MAILNGLYIHVVDETLTADVEITSHPVESGIPTTDTVKAKPIVISLSGKIVDYGSMTATQVLAKLNELKNSGSIIEYRGRNVASSMQIRAFETKHPNTNNGGADFNMELVQVRIAKSAYVPKTVPMGENMTIKVGSIVMFKGGSVYASSDAKKAAATRSRSKCKVTKISTASYSIHQYHLVSLDGKKVFGWVDKGLVLPTVTTSTSGKSNAGTQQTKSTTVKAAVYHTVKKGDTCFKLATVTYKSLGSTVDFIMKNNPKAFSRPGDATTLQVGKKILVGYKKTTAVTSKAKAVAI
jgi:hypothetical protein